MQIERAPVTAQLEWYGSITQIKKAWEVSRPADFDPKIENILKMDVPVNEFLQLQFAVTAPVLVREVICSMRNHVVWARSSRVDDLTHWKVAHTVTEDQFFELQIKHGRMMHEMKSHHQDDFRRLLPLAYMTTFSFQMSVRDFVRFSIWAERTRNVVLYVFCKRCLTALEEALPVLASWIDDLVRDGAYSVGELLPRPSSQDNARLGAFIGITSKVPLGLRAQFIRHRAIMIADNFADYLAPEYMTADMTALVDLQAVMHEDFAIQLVRKRSCWIAQTDLWKPIIGQLSTFIATDQALPCYDGQCRFKRDNDLRKADKDPSPPCPVAARLHGERMKPLHAIAAYDYAENRPNKNFWMEEIDNVA